MSTLKELRESKRITQKEAAQKTGISLRSYVSYENDPDKANSIKYRFLLQELGKINYIDEEHGVLQISQIRDICEKVFAAYDISYCYLFGSYAKGVPKENSDVDLLISSTVQGLKFYELAEKLREGLQKKVDLLDMSQLVNNKNLLNEILKEGIKIYG